MRTAFARPASASEDASLLDKHLQNCCLIVELFANWVCDLLKKAVAHVIIGSVKYAMNYAIGLIMFNRRAGVKMYNSFQILSIRH